MPRAGQRFAALSLALLLQLGLAIILASAVQRLRHQALPLKEMVWIFPSRLPEKPVPLPKASRSAEPSRRAAPIVAPVAPPTTSTVAPPMAAIQGLGRQLNGCGPEKYDSLPPEQRAACAGLLPEIAKRAPDADLMGAPSKVKNEALWQAELARAHAPALMPCLGGLDVMCLLMKMADGSLSDFGDPKTWPVYKTGQLPPEDFYKIEQAYAQWHKDHPPKAAKSNAP
jgi:hypothetical protein